MLTEPLTTPPTAKKQTWYAALTGILFPPQFHILSFYSTPELALVISNIFSYIVSPKYKLFPRLKEKVKITPDSADFVFSHGVRRFKYKPGQYMEWTLPHNGTDLRGNRRYFTLASSPTEPDLRIGIKFYQPSSSFKRTLLNITSGSPIVAAQVSGDFTMPRDSNRKLAFIAGGIGVTPYRSMVKYLLDTKEKRSVTLLYSARTSEDFAYQEVFEQARRDFGMNTKYIVTDQKISNSGNYLAGRLNSKLISSEIPDYMDRIFYISGTQPMVKAIKADLKELNIPRRQIKVDYFPGYG
jgi:ferredoxin-NADP reductase